MITYAITAVLASAAGYAAAGGKAGLYNTVAAAAAYISRKAVKLQRACERRTGSDAAGEFGVDEEV